MIFTIKLNKKCKYYQNKFAYITGPKCSWTGLFVISQFSNRMYKYSQGLDDFMKWMVIK